jgi:hypothetical protein
MRAVWLSTLLKLNMCHWIAHAGWRVTCGQSPGRCFPATEHCGVCLHHRPPGPLNRGARSARRQAKADFCILFGGLQKVRRLAGRDPPVLQLSLRQHRGANIKFAGPGRQPGYFPCSSKESNQRKDVHLAVGTTVARISVPATGGEDNECGALWKGGHGLLRSALLFCCDDSGFSRSVGEGQTDGSIQSNGFLVKGNPFGPKLHFPQNVCLVKCGALVPYLF